MNLQIDMFTFAIFTLLILALAALYSTKRWYLILPATLINTVIGAQPDNIIVKILLALLVLFNFGLIMVMKNDPIYKKPKKS